MRISKIQDGDELQHTWDVEVPGQHTYLLGNGVLSHNTSGKSINATESCEPIHDFFFRDEMIISVPSIVPEFKKYSGKYETAFEIEPEVLLRHAAIRQQYVDQSMSTNMYLKDVDSFKKVASLHLKAFDMGLKTLYYLKTQKQVDEQICESCT